MGFRMVIECPITLRHHDPIDTGNTAPREDLAVAVLHARHPHYEDLI